MTIDTDASLTAELVDEYAIFSVDDLCRLAAIERTYVVELVEEGVLRTAASDSGWSFSGSDLRRARTAHRLHRDLQLNLPGVALALELLAQVEELRRELNSRRP